jgi:hypothetical protein
MSRALWSFVVVVASVAVPCAAQQGPTPQDIEATLTAYCEHRVTCDTDLTSEACLADQPDVEKAAGVDDPGCADLVALLLAHYECQTALTCEALLDPTQGGCAATSTPLLDMLLTHGVSACFEGRPPVDPPAGWTCAPSYYNSGAVNDCDCGCGVLDRDCETAGVVGCGDGGCYAAGCDYCYADGDNVACDDGTPAPSPKPTPTPSPDVTTPSCAMLDGGAGVFALLALAVRRQRMLLARRR